VVRRQAAAAAAATVVLVRDQGCGKLNRNLRDTPARSRKPGGRKCQPHLEAAVSGSLDEQAKQVLGAGCRNLTLAAGTSRHAHSASRQKLVQNKALVGS